MVTIMLATTLLVTPQTLWHPSNIKGLKSVLGIRVSTGFGR